MSEQPTTELQREHFQSALRELDSFIDVALNELIQINHTAHKHTEIPTPT